MAGEKSFGLLYYPTYLGIVPIHVFFQPKKWSHITYLLYNLISQLKWQDSY